MPKSPALAFLMGMLPGAVLATIIVLHVVTNQVQARNAAISASLDGANAETIQTINTAQKIIAAWQARAETCEAKFNTVTVIYQPQAMATVPLIHGMASLELAPGSASKASLYIPAQVDIYTNRSDIHYQWIDGRTGVAKAPMLIAGSPSEVK